MALKRKSLAELHHEDQAALQTPGRPFMPPPAPTPATQSEIINTISEKRNAKSDFVKMSITVEPELFDEIQALSRLRRKQKQEFTFSAIIRDALKQYLKP
jgi:hypothetical protein